MGAPGRSPERSQAVPFVAEETSQEKLLAHSRILHVEKRIGMTLFVKCLYRVPRHLSGLRETSAD